MTTAERLDAVWGSVEAYPGAGPWMTVKVFYRASREDHLQSVEFQASSLNLESVVSVMLDEIEASLGIYQPQTEAA